MVDNARRTGVESIHDGEPAIDGRLAPGAGPLRTYDAWVLPIEVLLEELKVEVVETDLVENVCAVLAVDTKRTRLFVAPRLTSAEKEQAVRRALAERIGRAGPDVDPACTETSPESDVCAAGSASSTADRLEDLPDVVADVATLYEGSCWGPLNGWCSDEEAIAALRSLITESFGGMAEYVPADAPPMPAGAGAAVAFGYDEAGDRHPLIFMRTDIPSDLRADLWGFCVAVATSPDSVTGEPDENGIVYVGMERSPVTGPGLGLLGALMTQRMGRRPGDCAFSFLDSPWDGAEEVSTAA